MFFVQKNVVLTSMEGTKTKQLNMDLGAQWKQDVIVVVQPIMPAMEGEA